MAREEFRFSHPFRVRYSEIDGQKIVFNGHYLTYFDTAITEFFRWLPYDYREYTENSDFDFFTVRALVNFTAPILFDEQVDVCVRVAEHGRSSVTFQLEIYGREEEDLRASGEVTWVHVNRNTNKPGKLPAKLIQLIKK